MLEFSDMVSFETRSDSAPGDPDPIMKRTGVLPLIILVVLAGLGAARNGPTPSASAGPSIASPAQAPEGEPPHFWGGHFHNICPDIHRSGVFSFFRLSLGLGPKDVPPFAPGEVPPYKPDVVKPDLELIRHPDPNAIQVTWIGQSTFLVQFDGLNVLTDPLFSTYASPVPFAGPKRVVPPGLPFADLPPIDVVLVSHDHYDHLDKAAVRRLGNKPRYFVPLGLARWFRGLGIDRVTELDWWRSAALGATVFQAVPALHWSGRSPFSRNTTLWAGWAIETPRGRIYFAGDTGYCRLFEDIGRRLGPFRFAFLPIGTYRPAWYFKPMHMDPSEAVRAFEDVRAAQAVGMHWGTIKTSREPLGEPPLFLRKAMVEAGLSPDRFVVQKFGQTLAYAWRP